MSSAVSSYADLPAIRSALFNNPPDTVPPTDELEILHAELTAYKVKSLELAKKAGDDIRTIEESMRRLKEKEKGKAKAIQKAERERAFTPSINGDESRASAQPLSQPLRTRPSSVPVPPMPTPQPSRTSLAEELKKNKKKKRKREDSSDLEPEPPKTRKPSPLPAHTHPHPPPPQKPSKYPSTSLAFSKPANAPAFDLPTSVPLLPARPPVAPRPVAGPSKPTEVMEDFSKSKQPSQVQVNTFYTSIEPWLRPVKEEDVGFLQYTADEVEPFIMPKLGRHYSALWEEDDIAQYGGPLPGTAAMRASSHASPPSVLPKWEPSTLAEPDLLTEERGHGPLTERVVSALIPMHDATEWKGVKAAEEAMEGRPGTNGAAAAAARDKLNVADVEERMRANGVRGRVRSGANIFRWTPGRAGAMDLPDLSLASVCAVDRKAACFSRENSVWGTAGEDLVFSEHGRLRTHHLVQGIVSLRPAFPASSNIRCLHGYKVRTTRGVN
ncbi:hypothetical protein V8D89_003716 [Ganoderma adspersum]